MIFLVTGGSGSGKSEYAEDLSLKINESELIYIATMYPYDEETKKKISRHKEMRKNKGFSTIECYTNLKEIDIHKKSTILLDCISNLIANEMYNDNGAKERTIDEILKGITKINGSCHNLVIVSNEISYDGIDYNNETKRYIEYSCKVNKEISKIADFVIEVVYGIPICYKGSEKFVEFI